MPSTQPTKDNNPDNRSANKWLHWSIETRNNKRAVADLPSQDPPRLAGPAKKKKPPTPLSVGLKTCSEFCASLNDTLHSYALNFGSKVVKTFATCFYKDKKHKEMKNPKSYTFPRIQELSFQVPVHRGRQN